jgi:hypothetical protein
MPHSMVRFSEHGMVFVKVGIAFVLSGTWPKDPSSPAWEGSIWLVGAKHL